MTILGHNIELDVDYSELSENDQSDLESSINQSILNGYDCGYSLLREMMEGINWKIIEDTIDTVYEIKQFDIWFQNELCSFGMFTNRDKAVKEMMNGLENLYSGFKEDVCVNGDNQWTTDKFNFAIQISETSINQFGEL